MCGFGGFKATSGLTANQAAAIQRHESVAIGVSAISCWEIAKLVQLGRLTLPVPVERWLDKALQYPGMTLLHLAPHVAVESTLLPGEVHRDPADQIIVASARVQNCPLVTSDARLLEYAHLTTLA